jgi:hypothetical protein
MTPTSIIGYTRSIAPPPDWDEETNGPCETLQIRDQGGYMISAWRPSAEERRALIEGGFVLLYICGKIHPVVGLGVSQ